MAARSAKVSREELNAMEDVAVPALEQANQELIAPRESGSRENIIFPGRYLRFASFELDLQRQLLMSAGILIRLQGKLYKTLTVLLHNPGEVVTRETLQGYLWPMKTVIDQQANLNTTINKLRRILRDTTGAHPLIVTITGRGYLFAGTVDCANCTIVEEPTLATHEQKPQRFTLWNRKSVFVYSESIHMKPYVIAVAIASMLLGAAIELYVRRLF
jgi:DNA-binding winged helix-turn-helix (wHTH) protein